MRLFWIATVFLWLSFIQSIHAEEDTEDFSLIQESDPVEVTQPRDKILERWKKSSTGSRLQFSNTTKLLFAGDTMFNWGVETSIRQYGNVIPFEDWRSVFQEADYRFVNLESTLIHSLPKQSQAKPMDRKAYVFAGKKEHAKILKNMSVDAVFLGNNHAMDYGEQGLIETMEILEKEKIFHLGAGLNFEEAYNPLLLEGEDMIFSIFNASDVAERNFPFAKSKSPGVAFFQESVLNSKLSQSKARASQSRVPFYPVLSVHWGHEYAWEPTLPQRKSAKRLLDAGFSAIVGHHPHIPQGIEIYKNKPIIYSLGNFIFGSRNHYLNHNIVVILHYNATGVAVVEVIPSFGRFQGRDHIFLPLAPEEGDEFLEEYRVLCEKLGTKLEIRAGRGYVFLDKTMMRNE